MLIFNILDLFHNFMVQTLYPLLGNSFIGSTAKNVFWIFLLSQIEESIYNKTFFYGENNLDQVIIGLL